MHRVVISAGEVEFVVLGEATSIKNCALDAGDAVFRLRGEWCPCAVRRFQDGTDLVAECWGELTASFRIVAPDVGLTTRTEFLQDSSPQQLIELGSPATPERPRSFRLWMSVDHDARLRMLTLREASIVQGIPVAAGQVRFHADGRLQQARLARDFETGGVSYPVASRIHMQLLGSQWEIEVAASTTVFGHSIPADARVVLGPSAQPLAWEHSSDEEDAEPTHIAPLGASVPAGTSVLVRCDGRVFLSTNQAFELGGQRLLENETYEWVAGQPVPCDRQLAQVIDIDALTRASSYRSRS